MESKNLFTNRRAVIAIATFCCLLWGSAYPSIKKGYELFHIAVDDIPSKMVFAGYRFVLAGLIVLAIAGILKRKLFLLNKRDMAEIAVLGLTQTTLQYIFFYIGLSYTTGAKGSIMNSTGAFFGVLMAHLIYKNDRLNSRKIAGCLAGFAGVMMVNFSADRLDFHFSVKGEGAVILAAFILSAASIYGKKIAQRLDPIIMTGYQLTLGGGALLLVGYLNHGAITGFDFVSSSLMLYMAFISSVAFLLWAVLLKYNKVGEITVFNFLIPVSGTVLSALFLKENIMELKYLLALVLVSAGIWLVNRQKGPQLEG